ncbi:ABC transporter [Paenibacillus mucilaginosus 3016]|uniref:ABC transporter n=1 Tax=Paenibacillus mucilaginosus 3016 TaxID=1116391 RepID=H6NAZ1_9BACL|nr:ATP-binding cassette domain-containing protein [Paenibacillus mucilaginosus]AFC31246.1 ABC transporter [Paenibacillus mucilaginosus 3016]WFA19811.1 ATP-binding cassette domain-containing protein [Paenibacillus mucilaginosus]
MPGIIVEGLSKSFQYYKKEVGLASSLRNLFRREMLTKEAVKGISFEIPEGEIVGFLGPNGAGKTTTLKMLTGILYPTSGSASILGHVPWERRKAFKKQFAIVMGQKSQLWWDLPANESLHLNKHIYEVEDGQFRRTVDELAELLDVKELLGVQVRRLSLGERMKLELIASLLHQPRVLFLDEPTIGLDILSQRRIREFLKYYNQQQRTTIVLTSHYMNDIEDLCKRTIIVNSGRIVYDGSLAAVNRQLGQKKLMKIKLGEPVDPRRLERFGRVRECSGMEAVLEVDKSDLKERSKEMLEHLPVLDFTIEEISIEEGIALLYAKEAAS